VKELLSAIEEALKNSANYLPLELSSFLGGLIEEIVAPIPSPFVMAAVGSAAFAQSKGWLMLLGLALAGSAGKTLGAWVIYAIADKLEDVIVGRWGRFLGLSHTEVEALGKRFDGSGKDVLALFMLRALPIIPSSPVSAVCGIIKINVRHYLAATFAGNIPRNLIYIYLGYAGISAYRSFLSGLDTAESLFQVVLFAVLAALVGWIYFRRYRQAKKR
jgi:membrane protein DedA with SNARE-associated domain